MAFLNYICKGETKKIKEVEKALVESMNNLIHT
jgi:hypothetical protein